MTKEPKYPPDVHTHKGETGSGEKEEEEKEEEEEEDAAGRDEKKKRQEREGTMAATPPPPFSLLLPLSTCANICKRCSYIILPWYLMSQASPP